MQKKTLCFTALSKAFFSPATTSSLSSWEYVIWAFCQIRDRNGCRDTDTLIRPLQRFAGSSLGSLLSVRFVQSISSGEARWFYSECLLLSNLLTLSPAMSSDISKVISVVAAFSYFRRTYEQVAKIWTRRTYMAIVHAPFPDSTLETWLATKGRQPSNHTKRRLSMFLQTTDMLKQSVRQISGFGSLYLFCHPIHGWRCPDSFCLHKRGWKLSRGLFKNIQWFHA